MVILFVIVGLVGFLLYFFREKVKDDFSRYFFNCSLSFVVVIGRYSIRNHFSGYCLSSSKFIVKCVYYSIANKVNSLRRGRDESCIGVCNQQESHRNHYKETMDGNL